MIYLNKIQCNIIENCEAMENQYLQLLRKILYSGAQRADRTGVGTYSLFGYQIRHCLNDGFPLLTTKKVNFDAIVHELLWFLKGDTNIAYLNEQGVHIWDSWANSKGELGPTYGKQWRSWGKNNIDQIKNTIKAIETDPYSRRLLVSAWNVDDIPFMHLPPCHVLFQFYVENGALSMHLYQRSADIFLGVPFNIASYALLLMIIAHITKLRLGDFVHTFGDVHLYTSHVEQVKLQLSRQPRSLPTVHLRTRMQDIDHINSDDIILENYTPHPFISAPVAV